MPLYLAPTLISYTEITANVVVSAANDAAAIVVVTAPALVAGGSEAYRIEFYSPQIAPATNDFVFCNLFDNGADIGRLGVMQWTTNAGSGASLIARRLIPSAGSHTYSIRTWRSAVNGLIQAGPGGAATTMPGYLAISRA